MRLDDLYAAVDATLGGWLAALGFDQARSGEYIRLDDGGRDRIMIDPDGRRREIAVMLSYYPDAMLPVFKLANEAPEDQGFPCGPYLTPKVVSRRRRGWSYADLGRLTRSLGEIEAALKEVGLPWLKALRDPQRFAAEVDKNAVLPAALALELAGDFAGARRLYQEMYRRLRGIIDTEGTDESLLREMPRLFVFVCSKLGIEPERVDRFSRRSGYTYDGPRLP